MSKGVYRVYSVRRVYRALVQNSVSRLIYLVRVGVDSNNKNMKKIDWEKVDLYEL